jgi:hypothetical protein
VLFSGLSTASAIQRQRRQMGSDQDGANLVTALRAWPGSVDFIVAVCIDEGRLREASNAKAPADAFLQKPLYAQALTRCIGNRSRSRRGSRFDADSAIVPIE